MDLSWAHLQLLGWARCCWWCGLSNSRSTGNPGPGDAAEGAGKSHPGEAAEHAGQGLRRRPGHPDREWEGARQGADHAGAEGKALPQTDFILLRAGPCPRGKCGMPQGGICGAEMSSESWVTMMCWWIPVWWIQSSCFIYLLVMPNPFCKAFHGIVQLGKVQPPSPLNHTTKFHTCSVSEHFQGWWLHPCPRQPLPVLDSSSRKEIFPNIQPKSSTSRIP